MSSKGLAGVPIVLSGPSGTGKTTIRQQLLARYQDLVASISATTRPPRPGETHGRDYLFLSQSDFESGIAQGLFAEHAEVHGKHYGTPKGPLEEQLAKGADVLLVIDVQGGLQVKQHYPEALMIFLLPPSMAELRKRIEARRTDSDETIELRMKNAEWEMGFASHYDYWVINRSLEEAVREVRSIMVADRCRAHRAIARYARIGLEWPGVTG
jgi:guanylate kinase